MPINSFTQLYVIYIYIYMHRMMYLLYYVYIYVYYISRQANKQNDVSYYTYTDINRIVVIYDTLMDIKIELYRAI